MLQKYYREFPYTFHPYLINIILYNHSTIIKIKKLTLESTLTLSNTII